MITQVSGVIPTASQDLILTPWGMSNYTKEFNYEVGEGGGWPQLNWRQVQVRLDPCWLDGTVSQESSLFRVTKQVFFREDESFRGELKHAHARHQMRFHYRQMHLLLRLLNDSYERERGGFRVSDGSFEMRALARAAIWEPAPKEVQIYSNPTTGESHVKAGSLVLPFDAKVVALTPTEVLARSV